ncbi:MAG: zinc ribbon domain-containing protein [Treponema sp.]|nr:zinc ribbon domain-containing protein [Treponema sp.]
MINCKECGAENIDEAKTCQNCGAELIGQAREIEKVENTSGDEGKPWPTFAKTGYILGIVSLVFCWFPWSLFYLGGAGLVFSSLGKWSVTNKDKAIKGFNMSLISVILNFIITIIILTVGAVIASREMNY